MPQPESPAEDAADFMTTSGLHLSVAQRFGRKDFELLGIAGDGLRFSLTLGRDDLQGLAHLLLLASHVDQEARASAAAPQSLPAISRRSASDDPYCAASVELDLAFLPIAQQRLTTKNGDILTADPWPDGSRIVLRCFHLSGLRCILPLAAEESVALGRRLEVASQPRLGIPCTGNEHPLQLFGLHLDLRTELRELAELLVRYRAETTAATLKQADKRLGRLHTALGALLPLATRVARSEEEREAIRTATRLLDEIDDEETEARNW